jgi:hypothetical protein
LAIILVFMLGVLTAIIAPLAPQSAGAQGFTSNDDVSRPEPKLPWQYLKMGIMSMLCGGLTNQKIEK